MENYQVPRWYQDLSIRQMEMIFALGKLMKRDYEEKITSRTQKALREIGITSAFVEIHSKDIRNLWISSGLDPVKFLCDIYKFITGKWFEEESYKKFYDCNERIVLSSIAFLKLPETVLELHRRLPLGKPHKIPPKPKFPKTPGRKKNGESPYLELPVSPPDWQTYRNELRKWQELCKSRVDPQVILPVFCEQEFDDDPGSVENFSAHTGQQGGTDTEVSSDVSRSDAPPKSLEQLLKNQGLDTGTSRIGTGIGSTGASGISGNSLRGIETQGTLRSGRSVENTVVDAADFVSGSAGDERDEFLAFPWNRGPKKTFPPGRHNLSQKWQDFLMETDEDFRILEKEANIIMTSVRESTKKIFNPDVCAGCCACWQIREVDAKNSKTENLIIDNVVTDETGKRYLVGALGLTSPASSISSSSLNRPLIIPSEDKILKTTLIESITLTDKGNAIFVTSGITKQLDHIPEKIIPKPPLHRKNLSACPCASSEVSSAPGDPEAICTGQTYRKLDSYKCFDCSDNKVFADFEMQFREREKRENEKKKNERQISEPQLDLRDEPKLETGEEVEKLKCEKCNNEKCKESPFKEVLRMIAEENGEFNKKPSKSGPKEFKQNLKFSLTGVGSSDRFLLSGVTVHTPITITPVSSEPEIDIFAYDNHHHWSVTQFAPKKNQEPNAAIARSEKSANEREVMAGNSKNVANKMEEQFDKIKHIEIDGKSMVKKLGKKAGKQVEMKTGRLKKIDISVEKPFNGIGNVQNEEQSGDKRERKVAGNSKEVDWEIENVKSRKKQNLRKMMKSALEKMAEEGYVFARLPQCHKIPALQTWILYRKGFEISEKKRNHRLEKNRKAWEACEARLYKKIKAPKIQLTNAQMRALSWDQIGAMRQKVASQKKSFYSEVRKSRVLQSRAMWNLMDYDENPNVNFKKSYFMYEVSNENDGHVLRPYGFEAA